MIRVPLSEPSLGPDEERLLLEALRSGYVSSVGPLVRVFEEEFADRVGRRHAVACASGTAALHLALLVLGVSPGQDVLVSDLTFIASANPARYCQAEVILVDSELETWNLDPAVVVEELERRARLNLPQPAAVIAVHVLGRPARLEDLLAVTTRLGVPLIEDAAEALGATWLEGRLGGRSVGAVGVIGCFSFNGNKVITAGGGGMLVTDDEALADHARHLATQARLPGVAYRHDEVGFNYRLTNIAAAVGLAQLRRLDALVAARRRVAQRYTHALAAVPGVTLPGTTPWAKSSNWLYTVLLSDEHVRETVRVALDRAGIEARPIWPALRSQEPYLHAQVLGGARAPHLAARGLSLPSSSQLPPAAQERVIEVITTVLEATAT